MDIDLFGNAVGLQGHKHIVTPAPVVATAPASTDLASTCRYCAASVLRGVSDQGTSINLDLDAKGPFVIDGDGPLGRPLLRHVNSSGEVLRCGGPVIRRIDSSERRYASHFAKCPKADEWRRAPGYP